MSAYSEQKKAIGLSFILNALTADSPYGAEKLKRLKFFPAADRALLEDELYNVSRAYVLVKEQADGLGALRRLMMRFKNISKALKKCEATYLHEIELFEVKNFLLTLARVIESFNTLNGIAGFKDIGFIDMTDALDILDPDKKRIAPFSIGDVYSKDLWSIRMEKEKIEKKIHFEKDPIELEKLRLERLEIVVREEEEETKIKRMLSEKLAPFLPLFRHNMDNIGKLDFTIQKAVLAKNYGGVRPAITDGKTLVLQNMVNPEIAEILHKNGKRFTPVSMTLHEGTTILTGANMGGKSVAIKTAVLNVVLFRMGFFVFAEKCEIPMFDGVALISEDLQSIHKGLSTFGAEILRLNDIINRAKKEFLLIALDELARGTNPEEGAVIVKAVAKHFSETSNLCLMTTHYDNIVEPAYRHYQVAGLSGVNFDDILKQIGPDGANGIDLIAAHMDYRLFLKDGQTEPPRDALNICRLLSLDSAVLSKIERQYDEN